MINKILELQSSVPAAVLIRVIVGYVFFVEGIQKYLYPDTLGIGRFIKIGIPYPHVMIHVSAGAEIICGALLIIGLYTRLSTIPLIINISVAIISTKVIMFAQKGFWPAVHESRLDFTMLLSLVFLLIVGAGCCSIDAKLSENKG
jgi:putative oxidoreductase